MCTVASAPGAPGAASVQSGRLCHWDGGHEGGARRRRALMLAILVSGVPTVLVNGVPLFSGAIRADLMEAELRKAAGHVRS